VTLPGREFILGEKKNIGGKDLRLQTGGTLSGVTATVTIYDSAGNTVLAATSLTVAGSGTRRNSLTYLLTTGSGMTLTLADTYRLVYTVTYQGEVQIWQQSCLVKPKPF
jgi:hypothetical protein